MQNNLLAEALQEVLDSETRHNKVNGDEQAATNSVADQAGTERGAGLRGIDDSSFMRCILQSPRAVWLEMRMLLRIGIKNSPSRIKGRKATGLWLDSLFVMRC